MHVFNIIPGPAKWFFKERGGGWGAKNMSATMVGQRRKSLPLYCLKTSLIELFHGGGERFTVMK